MVLKALRVGNGRKWRRRMLTGNKSERNEHFHWTTNC